MGSLRNSSFSYWFLGDSKEVKILSHYLTDTLLLLLFFSCRWSAEFGAPRSGSPELHIMLAEYIYSESPEVVSLSGV